MIARVAALAALLSMTSLPAARAEGSSGQAIFETGLGLMPVIAGRPRPAMQGRMTCAGCHGVDGHGGREGGAGRAPAITWQALGTATADRPAYDADAFARAIRDGMAPDGRVLQMPRFEIGEAQLAALRDHLARLDHSETRDIAADRITLRLPEDPAPASAAAAAIAAFNAEGGSFGRKVVTGDAFFVDLGPVLTALRRRLTEAEQLLADQRRAAQPGWQTQPRSDSAARLELRRDAALAIVAPAPASLLWAREAGADLEAARIHALTVLVLEELRRSGRNLTRRAFLDRTAHLDLGPALAIYEGPPP